MTCMNQHVITPSTGIKCVKLSEDPNQEAFRIRLGRQIIEKNFPNWNDVYGKAGNGGTMSISKREYQKQKLLQSAIHDGLKAAVELYMKTLDESQSSSPSIQDYIPLSPMMKEILSPLVSTPYQLGHYRPDFIFDKHEQMLVCEINARFPLNGYICTYGGKEMMIEMMNQQQFPDNYQPMSSLLEVVKSLEKRFPLDKPLGVLKSREHGYSVHLFSQMSPTRIRFVEPKDLGINSNGYLFDSKGELRHFILELHQDEIFNLPKSILKTLFDPEKTTVLNDPRTIFLAHDKRMMAVLSSTLLDDHLPLETREILQSHIIPSFVVGSLEESLLKTLDKNEWLIKPCLFGKGEGIIFGKNCSNEDWIQYLMENKTHVLQRYVNQKTFPIRVLHQDQNQIQVEDHYVVGTLLCSDDTFLGTGIYRTSPPSDLIAISRGGSMLFPILRDDDFSSQKSLELDIKNEVINSFTRYQKFIPPSLEIYPLQQECCFHVSTQTDFQDVPLYQQALLNHGIAMINVRCGDPNSEFLTSLINMIGIPNPHNSTNDSQTLIWDVKYNPKQLSSGNTARSVSIQEFYLHTDCSFENPPPRFFALFVVQADRFDGGYSQLLDGKHILEQMSPEDLETLRTSNYRFRVPKEFFKGKEYIEGPILSNGNCFRFREDIIEPPKDDLKAAIAFENFKKTLKNGNYLQYLKLPKNTLILVDNCRFFHGRSLIKDTTRHLRRIRFHPKDPSLIPRFHCQ